MRHAGAASGMRRACSTPRRRGELRLDFSRKHTQGRKLEVYSCQGLDPALRAKKGGVHLGMKPIKDVGQLVGGQRASVGAVAKGREWGD